MADCAECHRPVADTGYICHHCTAALATTLLTVAQLVDELPTTIARQDRIDRPTNPHQPAVDDEPVHSTLLTARPGTNLTVRRPTGESAFMTRAMPINLTAAAHRDAISLTLTHWADHITTLRGVPIPPPPLPLVGPTCGHGWCHQAAPADRHDTCHLIRNPTPADPLAELAKFVASQLGWLRVRPEAEQAWTELGSIHRRAEQVVDRPPAVWWAGRCNEPVNDGADQCPQDLYVTVGRDWVRCPACGVRHSVEARREWLLREARNHNATAVELSRFLAAFGEQVSRNLPDLLRKWVKRSRIYVRGHDVAGKELFRVGDVMDLLVTTAQRTRGSAAAA